MGAFLINWTMNLKNPIKEVIDEDANNTIDFIVDNFYNSSGIESRHKIFDCHAKLYMNTHELLNNPLRNELGKSV